MYGSVSDEVALRLLRHVEPARHGQDVVGRLLQRLLIRRRDLDLDVAGESAAAAARHRRPRRPHPGRGRRSRR